MANTDINAPGSDGPALVAVLDRLSPVQKFRASIAAATPEKAQASPATLGWTADYYSANTTPSANAASSSANANYRLVGTNSSQITVIGAEFGGTELVNGGWVPKAVDVASGGSYAHTGYAIQFLTTGRYVDVALRLYDAHYRVAVDDEYVSLTNNTPGVAADGRYGTINLDLGSRKHSGRKIRFELGYANRIIGFARGSQGSLFFPAPAIGPKLVILGDSFVEGTGASLGSGGKTRNSFTWQAARRLGVENLVVSGWGGTGFLNNGSTKKTFRQRINDITRHNPDGVIVMGGQNDGGYAGAGLQTEVTTFFSELRAALPNAVITFMGPQYCPSPNNIGATAYGNIKSGVQAVPSVYHADVYDPSNLLYWMSGNTYNETGSYDGLNYWYVGSDGVHLNQNGHDFFGWRMAEAFKQAVAWHATIQP
ncbi:SGNH/GDSL hydrolase family protein [Ancylobacter terrae]|uniref:SGNH/GDSL hydrolase family protein n=1 Tax=Ancylobacter sp. sgz301288 TaxID=3342077 RepID=UPI00385A38F2